jgi:hypothetical protein
VADTISNAAGEMRLTAQSMSGNAEQTSDQAATGAVH